MAEYAHGAARTPLAAVLLDHAVEATSGDLLALGDLAASGASLQVPVVVSAAPSFFGLDAPTDFSRLPPTSALLQQPEYAAFRSRRTRPDAAFLTLAVPLPCSATATAPTPTWPTASRAASGCGAAARLVGMMMAAARRERWPTAAAGQAVEDLPVRATRMGAMPLAASFGDLDTSPGPACSGSLARCAATAPCSACPRRPRRGSPRTARSWSGRRAPGSSPGRIAEIDRFRAFLRGDGGSSARTP